LNFFSGPDDVIRKSLDAHPLMTSPPKSSNPKMPGYFLIEALRLSAFSGGLKQLSGSIRRRVLSWKCEPIYRFLRS